MSRNLNKIPYRAYIIAEEGLGSMEFKRDDKVVII